MLPIHTILHPTDFSEFAVNAYGLACSLARDFGARLIVLHVDPPPVCHGERVARRQEDYTETLWEEMHRVAPDQPKVSAEYQLLGGDVAAEILRTAREKDCDLIVMGTHGRTGLRRLLMGSVAERVMRQAPCPVVTVNGLSSRPTLKLEAEPCQAAQPSS
jgi:nucleotide-binding universal stress UspA family protein